MPRRFSKRLVIDVSVAFSGGGEDPAYPDQRPKQCRDFLRATLEICHRVVMSPEIISEWKRHESEFAKEWRAEMERKGKVLWSNTAINNKLRRKLKDVATTEKGLGEMLKDIILIEAAIATDQRVVSLDETARKHFAIVSSSVSELKKIMWVNPEKTEEAPTTWLKNGAPLEEERRLGFRIGES